MNFDFVGVAVLLVLAVLFGWLATRAWRARNAIVKWLGVLLAGLLTLVFGLLFVLSIVGFTKLNQVHPNPVSSLTVEGTPEQIARGEKFVQICAGCHSSTAQPPLNGQDFITGGPPMGVLYAPNLTPAHLASWSDGEIIRAIREGVKKDGHSTLIMPANLFHNMSDEDVKSVVAYLRSQPAVEPDTPPRKLNVLGALFLNLAPLFTVQEPITQPVVSPPEGPSAEYGEYLISIAGCVECHGENLTGGAPGGFAPAGPNLTVLVPNWTEEDFVNTIRTGVDPTGHQLTDDMPWKEISAFATDDDLRAMYNYLHGLTPVEAP